MQYTLLMGSHSKDTIYITILDEDKGNFSILDDWCDRVLLLLVPDLLVELVYHIHVDVSPVIPTY